MPHAPLIPARRRALCWVAGAALPLHGRAETLQPPRGTVVLSIGGRIGRTNDSNRAAFDMAMLEALTQQSFSTKTPWFNDARKFTGPLLRDVLGLVSANGTTLRIAALNDYRIDVPSEDTRRYDVVLARMIDDKPIPVREKGPLFMIYPFDSDPTLRTALYYSRSVWQLKSIDVL
ncbi:MAG TPA: hypothetical protein VFU71_14955 [Burkholderiaceae bacterium]|nr:hypothetical protein [Burkholderiaceae bacterium]